MAGEVGGARSEEVGRERGRRLEQEQGKEGQLVLSSPFT